MKRLTFIIMLCASGALGQCVNCEVKEGIGQICWGKDRSTTALHLAKFLDFSNMNKGLNTDEYDKQILIELNWLLENAPCLDRCLYTRGEKLLVKMIDHEKSKRLQRRYRKNLRQIKLLRTKYFPDEDTTSKLCG